MCDLRKSKEVQKRSSGTRHIENTNILMVPFGRTPVQMGIKRWDVAGDIICCLRAPHSH